MLPLPLHWPPLNAVCEMYSEVRLLPNPSHSKSHFFRTENLRNYNTDIGVQIGDVVHHNPIPDFVKRRNGFLRVGIPQKEMF